MVQPAYHRLTAPTGDWFVITRESFGGEGDRYTMERVVAWSVVTDVHGDGSAAPTHPQRVEGITASGHGEIHEHLEYWYVCGTDLAPDQRTWLEVYNETPHFNFSFKDISDAAARWPEDQTR